MERGKEPGVFDREMLLDLVSTRMPFGKYKGRILCDLPQPYLVWFERKGFPPGRIGLLLSALHVIKLNGLEYLLKPLRAEE
jgi:uncharacterized protein (DUF3820 family)